MHVLISSILYHPLFCIQLQETLTTISKCNLNLKSLRHKRRHNFGLPVTDVTLVALCGICPTMEELHLVDKAGPNTYGVNINQAFSLKL